MIVEYDKKTDELILECDACGVEATFQGINFTDSIQEARDNGWIIRRQRGGEFLHYCCKSCEAGDEFK